MKHVLLPARKSLDRAPARPVARGLTVSPPRPLEGLRVLDLSRAVAGPFAGRMLSDLGADVVKVEGPEEDVAHAFGQRRDGIGGLYFSQNAGKRSVYVDLKRPGGPELVLRLAERADLAIENFRPGVLARLGLSFETLSARNPRLLLLSVTGFGQQGRDAGRPAFAPVIHAEAGWLSRVADLQGTPPVDPGVSAADSIAALSGLVGLLAALHLRQRTGRGQHLDLSMLHAWFAADDYAHALLDGEPLETQGGLVWEAPGGPLFTGETFKVTWWHLRRAGLLDDPAPQGADLASKIETRRDAVQRWMSGFADRGSLEAELTRAGVVFGALQPADAMTTLPSTEDREIIRTLRDEHGAARSVIDSPFRYSAARAEPRGPAPRRGQHTGEVLREWLSLEAEEIERLESSGVLRPA